MKKTKQKQIILEIVNNSYDHLTAYQIYQQARIFIPNISLGTVYRNLNYMVENKIIKKIGMNNESDRFDRIDEHVHFICNKCKKIIDINDYKFNKRSSIENNLVVSYEIIIRGICKECQKEE